MNFRELIVETSTPNIGKHSEQGDTDIVSIEFQNLAPPPLPQFVNTL